MISDVVVSARSLFPGVIKCDGCSIAAVFLNEHYGAPAMLFALLLGLSFKGVGGPLERTIIFQNLQPVAKSTN